MKKAPAIQETVTLAQVEDKLITVRGQSVLLDCDVAALYAVETREINQAIQRNSEKFPEGYVIQLEKTEWQNLRSQFVILENGNRLITNCDKSNSRSQIVILNKPGQGHNLKYYPKAFTEKGLYMLATILKGPRAILTAIAIVETFAKIRELTRTVARLSETKEKFTQQSLMQKGGEIMADILGEGIKTTDTETSFELNFAVMKLKHTVKRRKQ